MRPQCLEEYIYFLIFVCWLLLSSLPPYVLCRGGGEIRLPNNSLVAQCMPEPRAMSECHSGCLEHARLFCPAYNKL